MFRIRHLNHSGGLIAQHQMVGGTLSYSFRAGSPGDISYQLANSIGGITRDAFASYKTDYMLQYQNPAGGAWENIQGGIHVPVNIKNDEDAINVAGKDWAHWLEQPYWFKWYAIDYTDDIAGKTARDTILDHSHSYATGIHVYDPAAVYYPPATFRQVLDHLVANTQPAGRQAGLGYPGLSAGKYVPLSTKYQAQIGTRELPPQATMVIMFQDTTTVLQHINNLAAFGEPYGFDWTMNPNRVMEFFGPRKEVRYAPRPIWTITKDQIYGGLAENPLLELDWTNNGPLAAHLVGTSNGNPGPWWHKRDQESVDLYREWLRIETLGDQYWRGPSMRHALDGLDYLHPQKDLRIVVLPSLLTDGFKNHIGDVVRLKWDFPPYHEVNAFYWINEQTYDSEGEEWKLALGLQQIYD
jgi:hypothetical protein